MKKLIAVMLCALLLVTAIACSKKPEPSPAPANETELPETGNTEPEPETGNTEPEPEPIAEPEPEPIAEPRSGGWTVAEDPTLTDELRAIYEKGLAELVGVNYVPIALLGTQVVAGTNYCFLSQGTVVYPGSTPMYMLVYLYKDLSGNVSLLRIENMPIIAADDGTLSVPAEPGTLMGGWAYADSYEVTDEMKDRLNKALEETVGAEYEPIANLGTQVVAGLNRCLLCRITPVVPDPVSHYALVYVYEDLEGGAALNYVIDFSIDMPEGAPDADPEAEAAPEAETNPETETNPEAEAEAANEPIVLPELPNEPEPAVSGGWAVAEDPAMDDARSAIFAKALEQLVGVDYVPVTCLGTQIVAGMNYCFLAKATVVYPGAQPKLVLVYVYEDLSGNAKIMNFADMPVVPNDDGSAAPISSEGTLDGGWFYVESPEITDEIRGSLGKALNTNGYIAVYEPVANLAEQIVAGTNRCLLVRFTERIPDARPQYKLIYIYEALDGTAEITNMLDFDCGALCTYGA